MCLSSFNRAPGSAKKNALRLQKTLWRESGLTEGEKKPTTPTHLTRLTFEPPSSARSHKTQRRSSLTGDGPECAEQLSLGDPATRFRHNTEQRAAQYFRGNDTSVSRCSVHVTSVALLVVDSAFQCSSKADLLDTPADQGPLKSCSQFTSKLL